MLRWLVAEQGEAVCEEYWDTLVLSGASPELWMRWLPQDRGGSKKGEDDICPKAGEK